MKIIFLSHTLRSSIFKVGSYHLSKQMALLGHEVLYISSPLSIPHLFAYFLLGRRSSNTKRRIELLKPCRDDEGVINFVPCLLFPFVNKGLLNYYKLYKSLNIDFSNSRNVVSKLGFSQTDLVIQDSLKLNFIKKKLTSKKVIYRATDMYEKMPDAPKTIAEAEHEAISSSDLVFGTSYPLGQYLEEKYKVSVQVSINGVEYDSFARGGAVPEVYKSLKGVICVYVGSMDSRFDFELVEYLGGKTNVSVVLIGPVETSRFDEYENICCLGEIENEELPPYLTNADVGLLPFRIIDANHSRSPMKIYEYGAAGLPVISTNLKEIAQRDNDFVLIANDRKAFHELILEASDAKEELGKNARAEAKKYGWETITEKFFSSVV